MGDTKCTLSNSELVEKVSDKMSEICKDPNKFVMHIPPRMNEDFDMLVSELCNRFKTKISKT